ncbi:lens induction in camera-type eye [Branchiostoma belcheri]|nr:lens induction in camera-type eye [Branchiostoma belcheri]
MPQKKKAKRLREKNGCGMFRAGHTPWNKGLRITMEEAITSYHRPTEDQESLYVNKDRKGNILQNDDETVNEVRRTMVLRAEKLPGSRIARFLGKQEKKEDSDEVFGYRIWHAMLAVHACTSAQRQHDTQRPGCTGLLRLSARGEKKKGLATLETLVCDFCEYKSPQTKFYGEVKTQGQQGRGPRIAVPNMAIQVGMFNSPMGPQVLREIAAVLDLPVPSRSGLQKMANKYSDIMVQENERDMQGWRETVQEVHQQKGNEPGSGIPVEMDTRFQSPLRSARGRKPGQPSSNSITSVAENVTNRKVVIGCHVRNKVCPTCNYNKGCGEPVPPHKCVANIPEEAVIGDEAQAARDIGKKLVSGPVKTLVSESVTDGDSSSTTGLQEVMMEEAGQKVTALQDTVHLGKNLRGRVTRGAWSKDMFPGKNQEEKNRVRDRFGNDLSKRLNVEHTKARKIFRHKKLMVAKMTQVMQTIPYCYAGDHSRCFRGSLVCRHPRKWTFKDLPEKARGHIQPNDADLKLLKTIMEHRLGKQALRKTRTGRSTNKVESLNRQISKTCPKNVLFSRTLEGRAASAVHSSNNGTGLSIVQKCAAAGIPLSPDSPAVPALEEMQRKQDYHRAYKRELANKRRQQAKIAKRYATYDVSKEQGTYKSKPVAGQCKGRGKGKGLRKKKKPVKNEHSYCRDPEEDSPDSWSPDEGQSEQT